MNFLLELAEVSYTLACLIELVGHLMMKTVLLLDPMTITLKIQKTMRKHLLIVVYPQHLYNSRTHTKRIQNKIILPCAYCLQGSPVPSWLYPKQPRRIFCTPFVFSRCKTQWGTPVGVDPTRKKSHSQFRWKQRQQKKKKLVFVPIPKVVQS